VKTKIEKEAIGQLEFSFTFFNYYSGGGIFQPKALYIQQPAASKPVCTTKKSSTEETTKEFI
jgi:hypothetical protein